MAYKTIFWDWREAFSKFGFDELCGSHSVVHQHYDGVSVDIRKKRLNRGFHLPCFYCHNNQICTLNRRDVLIRKTDCWIVIKLEQLLAV